MRAEKMLYRQTYTTVNIKVSPPSRRKIIGVSNLDPHKRIESSRSSKYWVNIKDFSLLI